MQSYSQSCLPFHRLQPMEPRQVVPLEPAQPKVTAQGQDQGFEVFKQSFYVCVCATQQLKQLKHMCFKMKGFKKKNQLSYPRSIMQMFAGQLAKLDTHIDASI